jgi:hypothetical protein
MRPNPNYSSGRMKNSIARISLAVSGILFFMGPWQLCACPGWYALAAVFAGVAAWAGSGRMRKWSFVWLAACLLATGADTLTLMQEHRKAAEWHRTHDKTSPSQNNAAH